MGSVVAATHIDLQERRALKILHHDLVNHPDIVERFLREARAVARLKSEHVAQVHDVGKLDTGEPYIVMEYLDGMDLAKVFRERKKLPIDEAVMLIHQVCLAVEEAHSLGIVHRDLKPGNLFVTKRANGQPCMKVLDFGISKIPESKGGGRDLTKVGEIMGSPSYMAPEQIRSLKNTDARADIWALGVILYEACTGQKPFRKTEKSDVMLMVMQANPMRPSLLRADMPAELEQVILRCLEKDPANRYPNIQSFLDDLRPYLPGPPAAPTWTPGSAARPPSAPMAGLPVIPAQVVPTLPGPNVSDKSHVSVSGTAVLPRSKPTAPAPAAAPAARAPEAPTPAPAVATSPPLPWRTTARLEVFSPAQLAALSPATTPSSPLVPVAHTPIPGSGIPGSGRQAAPSLPDPAAARGFGPPRVDQPPSSGELTASNHTTASWGGSTPHRTPMWPIATALIIAVLGIGVAAGLYSYIRWGLPVEPAELAVPPAEDLDGQTPLSAPAATLPAVEPARADLTPTPSSMPAAPPPSAAAPEAPTASTLPPAPPPTSSATGAPGTPLAPAAVPKATSAALPASPPQASKPAPKAPPAPKDADLFGTAD